MRIFQPERLKPDKSCVSEIFRIVIPLWQMCYSQHHYLESKYHKQ